MVVRTPGFNVVLPQLGLAHRSKVFFERLYLRQYR
jgi:hypothetical protein